MGGSVWVGGMCTGGGGDVCMCLYVGELNPLKYFLHFNRYQNSAQLNSGLQN